jgi:coproporphyrinogen III oxidase
MSHQSAEVHECFEALGTKIVQSFEAVAAGEHFEVRPWFHEGGGGGVSRLLIDGECFEKAGINFSHVEGLTLPPAALENRSSLTGARFLAIGVSVVVHPRNPHVPTTHANVRYIETEAHGGVPSRFWFGGGFDLTPYYPRLEDCIHWHRTAADLCRPFGEELYSRFKTDCDRYFYLKHREESRGIGGIFFDDLQLSDFALTLRFALAVGQGFLDAYLPIFVARQNESWGKREREFQLMRRSRYVEFNLLYDRGTLFGLQTGGRVDSILMSLPPLVGWRDLGRYDDQEPERWLREFFLKPRDWLDPGLKSEWRKQVTK